MQKLPHRYSVKASAGASGAVSLTSGELAPIESAPPTQFGGPGDKWSPEELLAAAVGDCFILSFRAIARASKLEWLNVSCDVEAVLDRVDGVTHFTEFHETVALEVPAGTDEAKAMRLIEKAEKACLVTNSLSGEVHLDASVSVAT